jgi:hypothetical protein
MRFIALINNDRIALVLGVLSLIFSKAWTHQGTIKLHTNRNDRQYQVEL